MKYALFASLLLAGAALPSAASAQQASITQTIAGTRLDISATGEVTRVPDVAIITAGVVSRAASATAAMQDSADRMQKVLGALKRAGVDDRDMQTSSVSLSPEYRYPENQTPQLVGYTGSNQLTIKFRDIRNSGKILDALVNQGRESDQRAQSHDRQARSCSRRSARECNCDGPRTGGAVRPVARPSHRSRGIRVGERWLCCPAAGAADADDDGAWGERLNEHPAG